MLKKLYDKSSLWFALLWIILYCVLMSVGDSLSSMLGVEKSITLPIGLCLCAVLYIFLKKNGLFGAYGLCRSKVPARSMLYYIPIFFMMGANLFYGLVPRYDAPECVLFVLSMLCVGFLEELIFRGLLFEAMRKDNLKAAVIVSGVTFGIGHIMNLVNGSGAQLLANLLQVVYATAAGFLFVMIYYKTKSLLVCIAAHGIFNALSIFVNEANITQEMQILTALFLTVVTGSYAAWIAWTMKEKSR